MAPLQRDQLFQLRVTTEEKEMLTALADRDGVTASDYIRLIIRANHTELVTEQNGFGAGPKRAKDTSKKTTAKKK